MKKTNARNELTSFVVDGTLSTVAVASATALYNDVGWPPAVLIGFGGVAALTVISRRWPWRSSSSRVPQWSRAFQSMVPLSGGGYTMKWHDKREKPEEEEFVFFGLGLPVPISEGTLHRFVSIARRRQKNALFDTQFSMLQAGNNFKRLRINWVLSQNYYTRKINPRLAEDEYFGCLMVLGYTRLLIGRVSGSSGRLFGDVVHWQTERYTRTAKQRWLALSPTRSPNLVKKMMNFYN
jgi:hypothetical protein